MDGLRLALNNDVPMLPVLLEQCPDRVLVHNLLYCEKYRLADLCHGPYILIDDYGTFVLHGFDTATAARARLRIVDRMSRPGVVQWCNQNFKEWGETIDCWSILIPIE
jgi:hypothetical protein